MKIKTVFMTAMLTLLLCGTGFAQTTFEARGSAIMPGVYTFNHTSDHYCMNYIWITNVSGKEVACKITPFDHEGNDISELCDIFTGNNQGASSALVASGTGSFVLPAGETRFIRIYQQANIMVHGHAVIEWTSTDSNIRTALVATGAWYRNQSSSRTYSSAIQINGGMPF